jgi:hypothetical protein
MGVIAGNAVESGTNTDAKAQCAAQAMSVMDFDCALPRQILISRDFCGASGEAATKD